MERVIASENLIKEVTLSLDTSSYASGDLLADTQEISDVFQGARPVILYSLRLLDIDDQGGALDILLLEDNTSMGTENDAFSPSDANAKKILTAIEIATANYVDFDKSQMAMKSAPAGDAGMGIVLSPAAGESSLYVAAISRDTKTYSASEVLELHFGFLRP